MEDPEVDDGALFNFLVLSAIALGLCYALVTFVFALFGG